MDRKGLKEDTRRIWGRSSSSYLRKMVSKLQMGINWFPSGELNVKKLLDEAEHIKNYQDLGRCYLPKAEAE